MKAFKRGFSLFLAILLLVGTIPTTVMAAFADGVTGKNEIYLQNDFIKVTVNPKNGRFGIQTVDGQPERKKDQETFLTFLGGLFGDSRGDSDTSFTTFRINGTDYIFGNHYNFTVGEGIAQKTVSSVLEDSQVFTHSGYDAIPEGCQAVVTPWTIEGVTITQMLLLYPDVPDEKTGKLDNNSGNVQVYYQIENKSGADVQVGARILLDTKVGANDGPEFQIGTISSNTLKVERMLSRDPAADQGIAEENTNYWTLPGYWVMKDTLDPSNPLSTNVIGYGYTNLAGYRDLDYMIVSHWNKLANEKFEEFSDYRALLPEQAEAAAELSQAQRLAERAAALAEQKKTEWDMKQEAAAGAQEGTKAYLDAQKAEADYKKVKAAAEDAAENVARAQTALEAFGRTQIGSSTIDPNLDFTNDLNDYGSADSAVAFFWSDEGDAAKIANNGKMQLGTVYGLGEIIDPASVLGITFPDPVTQVEIDPNDQDNYKNYGVFDIHVEVENLQKWDMRHDSIDITMELEKGLRFVKRDSSGNILRDESGKPLTSYGTTQVVTYEKAVTPEQAEAGERNPILPGEKIAATFTVMAIGKAWPTTRQYMVTATSPQLEMEFESKYGNTADSEIKALYNSSRANFVFLPAVGSGTPTYATSVSPEECYTKDPKYITVNLTNIEAYNPGSSVRGQESNPNFNLYLEEIATGMRYQVDVTDNVQCIVTDDGLTGDMRISYTNGTLVDADGIVLKTDLGYELPVGQYRVEVDYISTDEEENTLLDLVTDQTFLVTENEESRIREPAILAVVKETVDFDDGNLMQKIEDLVAEVQTAIEELEKIAEKLEGTDWSDAVYEEVVDFAKELVSPVTQIYDSMEKLADFSNIESEMRELSKSYDELADVDFSSIKNFDIGKAIKGVNVSVDLSDEFKSMFDVESLLLGPLGLSGVSELAEGGVDGIYDSIKNYGSNILSPITDVYTQMASLSDFNNLSDSEVRELKAAFGELSETDVNALIDALKTFKLDVSVGLESGKLEEQFKKIADVETILAGPFGDDGVEGIYESILEYGKDIVSPITNLYDDLVDLADFSDIDKEIDELVKVYPELADVDFDCLKDFDFTEAVKGLAGSTDVKFNLTDAFKEKFDYETILAGPFASKDGKDAVDVFCDRVKDYGLKVVAPITSIYDELEDLADFSDIKSEMEGLSKNFEELEGVDFSFLENYNVIQHITGSVDVDVSFSEKCKEMFQYDKILAGPTSFDLAALSDWLDAVNEAVESGERIYELGKSAYQSKDVKVCAETLVKLYKDLLNVNIDIDSDALNAALEEAKEEGTQALSESKKLALAFVAMYAKMQNIYSDLSDRYGKATDIYRQVDDIKDEVVSFVKAIGNGDYKTLLSMGTDMVEFVLGEWLNPVRNAVNSAKDIYDIGQKAYTGKLSVREGGQLLMDFYEEYLDVNVKVDWKAAGEKNVEAANATAKQAKQMAAAFMVMYARMQSIYSSIDKKVDRATEVYNQVRDIVNTVIKLINVVADGDYDALVDQLLDLGADIITSVLNAWLAPIQEALASAEELCAIGKHAYRGDLSAKEGAQQLIDFYETYLNVSVTADMKGLDGAVDKSKQTAAAFVVMYSRMSAIYAAASSRVDTANSVYHSAMSIIGTLTKLLKDPMAAVNDLVNMGKDAIFDILDAYLDKINEMVDSVKEIYEIGKRAYEGDLDVKEGAELLIGFYEKYLNVSISADLDAVGEENKKAATETYQQGKKMALAFMAMYARMKNIYSGMSAKYNEITGIYDQMMEVADAVMKLFTDPVSGAYALMDMVKARIMDKLDGLGMYKDMFLQVMDVIENFDQYDPAAMLDEAMNFAVTTARVKADQALYTEIYGLLVTAATALDPNSDYEWDPGELKTSLPTYTLMSFADEAEFKEYEEKVAEQNKKRKAAEKDEKKKAQVGNDGVMVKVTGMIRQIGAGEDITDYIVDTSTEPAILNDTVAFKGGDLVFTRGKLKISLGSFTLDAGEYISEAQKLYGSETPLFDTLIVSGTGDLYIEGSGFMFHQGEWSLDFYNGFDKILDPVTAEDEDEDEEKEKKNENAESDALNETAAWAIGALNDLFNPLKALTITDVYFNRHTLFSAPNFSVAGFGLKFDNYLLRSSEVCFGGHIDFKIVSGEIQNVFFNRSGLQSIEADLKFGLPQDLGLLQKDESVGGNLIIHYYDPDYVAYVRRNLKPDYAPEEKYGLDFSAKLKNVGGVAVELSFKRVADGRILPDVIGFEAQPPAPGIMVYASVYLTEIRGAIRELADTIAGGSGTIPLTIEAGVDIQFGVAPATFDGEIDMILKMTGIEFNGKLGYKNKPMITQAQIKAQWVTPWFVSASMEMDVLGLNIIIGKARLFIGQNLEKNRIDFEGFVSAALQIPKSVPIVGGFQLGQVSFGLNNDKIWGSASVGVKPIAVSVGITYYWGGGIEFGTDGESLPEAYSYLLVERPEEEPVLLAIGSGIRTEATSWVNESAIHEIVYHAIGDGVSYLDNGQNDIGIGGIEVSNSGKTHTIPMDSVAPDRDALIEIQYYGDDVPTLNLVNDSGEYPLTYGIVGETTTAYNAFRQELVTEDGVNRHLVYVIVPRGSISGSFTLTASERVQTKLLSTPIASALDGVTLTGSGTNYTATVTVADPHAGDTVDLYLTRETVGTAVEYVTTDTGDQIPVTEDNDPGVLIFAGIPADSGTVTQVFDLADICGYGGTETKTNIYAVDGLRDIRELLESGEYYLRAALKSDTAYDAMTSANRISITDPKAPAAAGNAALTYSGNGYFDLSFAKPDEGENAATAYRVDFYEFKDGVETLYPNYNGLIFETGDLAAYYNSETKRYENLRLGGWTVTGGEGTGEAPYTYTGLKPGKTYVTKVYAASRTDDGNYHYAAPTASVQTLLREAEYVSFTSIKAADRQLPFKTYTAADGSTVTTTARQLVTNQTQPELTLTPSCDASVTAYNGDEIVGTMDSGGTLKLTGLRTDGEYAVELRATNKETGDLSVAVVYVTIDTEQPALLVTSPAMVTTTKSAIRYDSSGNAVAVTDTKSGSTGVNFNGFKILGTTEPGSTVTVTRNDGSGVSAGTIKVNADGSFEGTATLNSKLARGEIQLTVTDRAGNTNTAVIPVTNSVYASPIGINVVRTGTMKMGATQTAQVYLKYADGKSANGTQKYRSAALPAEDREKVSYSVLRGDAVTVDGNGRITAAQEGASLLNVSYRVNDDLSLDTTMAILVDDSARPTGPIGGETGGGSAGGGGGGGAGAAAPASAADVVINGKSATAETDSNGTSTVKVSASDGVVTTKTLAVENLSKDAENYTLEVSEDVARELSGENGKGVSFSGGKTQVVLPGNTLSGSALSITVSDPSAAERTRSIAVARQLDAAAAAPGSSIKLTGTAIEPGDRATVRLEIPAGVDTKEITSLIYIDENGSYTNLPWKLDVAGNTAYIRCRLPGSGTVVPVSAKTTFTDVSADFWGVSGINEAAEQMLIRGYDDGTFRPLDKVTREEFATITLRAGGLMTAPKAAISFVDINRSDWSYDTVCIAAGLGILKGDNGYVRPHDSITRAEGMAIASRLLKLEKLTGDISDAEVERVLSGFIDKDDLPEWARKEIALCVRSGIINGSDGAIKPNDPLSRVEAALIATRFCAAVVKTL